MSESYTVLARKYRSQDFASLIGQDVLVKTLTTAINTDRIAHAYIFTGIRGTGKTSTARILAKALNCTSSDKATATPCGKCENCRAIAAGQHIDVLEIDAASHTGVDNMRDILDSAQYRPTNGRYKVYIIDEVHMLSTSAFNALLKTLEEPPEHIVFILATTEIRKVPVTILSRCQRFDLVRIPVETLKKHFAWMAAQEGIELSDGANELIARAADGSARDGVSLLDQAIAQTGGKVSEVAVLEMLKRADRGAVVDFMRILLSGDTAAALTKVDDMYGSGADLAMLLSDMMEWTHWATRMHPSLRLGDSETAPYTADQRAQINKINETATLNTLSRIWQVMVASVEEMQKAGNQKQCFDMLVVRLMHIADMPPIPALLEQETTKFAQRANAPALAGGAGREAVGGGLNNNTNEPTPRDFVATPAARAGVEPEPEIKPTAQFIQELREQAEKKAEEAKSDPAVAAALDLFAGAEIVSVK
ncbi:MAG: DNA polymerase III subunit gamma/tau [Rickettsiales bacterium]|jgi:DNA polymerase-3 subunit gamma/tau|nr:DNA polymerase III subunit gamma/tau [Rickettsiales bacterium]